MCIKEKIPPLHVAIIFANGISKKRENLVTQELFKIVKNNYSTQQGNLHIKNDIVKDLPNEFHSILISSIIDSKRHFWIPVEASFVVTNFSDELQHVIEKKADKLDEYLEKCDKCWLVITALGNNCSSFYEYSKEMEKVSYDSPFEKVFFMEAFTKNLKEMNCN